MELPFPVQEKGYRHEVGELSKIYPANQAKPEGNAILPGRKANDFDSCSFTSLGPAGCAVLGQWPQEILGH